MLFQIVFSGLQHFISDPPRPVPRLASSNGIKGNVLVVIEEIKNVDSTTDASIDTMDPSIHPRRTHFQSFIQLDILIAVPFNFHLAEI